MNACRWRGCAKQVQPGWTYCKNHVARIRRLRPERISAFIRRMPGALGEEHSGFIFDEAIRTASETGMWETWVFARGELLEKAKASREGQALDETIENLIFLLERGDVRQRPERLRQFTEVLQNQLFAPPTTQAEARTSAK